MARQARKKSMSCIYHIILRGINRQYIFDSSDEKQKVLETLNRYKVEIDFDVLGYCVMSNHIHLLLKEGKENISITMKRICSCYAHWYNYKHERIGHLFQERFKSETVEDDAYLLTALRYIHMNPVKAGIEADLAEYQWSSHNAYVYGSKLINVDYVLDIFSENRKAAITIYDRFIHEENDDLCFEDDANSRISDDELRNTFEKMYGSTMEAFHMQDKQQQNIILKETKQLNGVTIRQLARVLGISKFMVEKALQS